MNAGRHGISSIITVYDASLVLPFLDDFCEMRCDLFIVWMEKRMEDLDCRPVACVNGSEQRSLRRKVVPQLAKVDRGVCFGVDSRNPA